MKSEMGFSTGYTRSELAEGPASLTVSRPFDPRRDGALLDMLGPLVPPRWRVELAGLVVLPVVRTPPGRRRDGETRAAHAARRRLYAALRRRDRRRGHGPSAWRQRATHIPAAIIVPTTIREGV